MTDEEGPAREEDYSAVARAAFDRGDDRLALEQLSAALTFDPSAPDRLAMVDVVFHRNRAPDALFSTDTSRFFGEAALLARLRARQGKLGEAIQILLTVVASRPDVPYLEWVESWLGSDKTLRGVDATAVLAGSSRIVASADREGWAGGVRRNGEALATLLARLAAARPKAPRLAVLEAVVLGRLGRHSAALDRLRHWVALGDADAIAEAAALERRHGDVGRAVSLLEALKQQRPADDAVALDHAEALWDAGEWERAIQELDDHLRRAAASDGSALHATFLALSKGAIPAASEEQSEVRRHVRSAVWFRRRWPRLEDPVAGVVRNAIERASQSPPAGPLIVRIRSDRRPSSLAALALNQALAARGLAGSLLWHDEPVEVPELRARAHGVFDADAWATAAPVSGDRTWEEDPVSLALLDAVADLSMRAASWAGEAPLFPTLGSLWELASGSDEWWACAAITVLAAAARRAGQVAAIFEDRMARLEHEGPRWTVACHGLLSLAPTAPEQRRQLQHALKADEWWRPVDGFA